MSMQPPLPEVPGVDPSDVPEMIAAGAHLIDVRETEEWNESRIAGAELLPMSTIETWYEGIPTDRTVILFCRSGRRSALATDALIRQAGRDNVVNMEGGILAWAEAGLEIETG